MGYIPLPAANPGGSMDFQPLQNAFAAVADQNNRNAILGLQQRSADRADQQFALDKRNSDLDYQSNLARQSAGIAQAALNERDPAKKAAIVGQLYGLHPEYRDKLVASGLDPNDSDGVANFIVSQARGYVNPLDAEAAQAKIAESRASAAKSNAEARMLTRQGSMLDGVFGDLGGSPSDAGPTISSGAPVNAFAQFSPTNALAQRGPTTVTSAPAPMRPSNAFANMGATRPAETFPGSPPGRDADSGKLLPDFAGSYRSAPPSTSLPAPGDPTSFTGNSASGLTTPQRFSPDTIRALKYDLAFNGGKGSSSIINNDPGSQYEKTYANKTAEDNAALNLKQKMTAPLLAQIQHMRELATDAGSDVLTKATGPDYSEGQDGSWLPGFLHPDTSGQPYQNLRAWGHWADFPGRAIGMDDAESYDKAAKVNLQMQHIKKMLGASVKALPGTKGGGASTDQDQALVLDAVGEALHAQDPETFFKILHDAQNGLRARSGMPPLPEPKSYIPDQWNSSSQAAQANPKLDALAGARDAIAKGANPAAVRQRLLQNGINPEGL